MRHRKTDERKRKTPVRKAASKPLKSRIPDFKTEADEAKFWDTHDIADFEDELVEDNDLVFVRPEAGFIELHGKTWDKVVETAIRKRTTPEKLVHRWVRERLVRK